MKSEKFYTKLLGKNLVTYTDEALIKEVAAGNSQAFTLLYQRFSRPLFRYFLRLLFYDKEKAEDFLQDLFMKILQSASAFDEKQKASTWIYTLATNMCRNEWRNVSNRKKLMEDFEPWEMAENAIEIEQIDATTFAKVIEELVELLPEIDREVLLLRFQEELPIKEIATIVNLPEGTVKSKLFYLLKKIAVKVQSYKHLLNP